ncbi:CBS domain-containing protein CBSX1, chloroplastic [Apostasia shenzhenica]|uniref:CBS domain-containing protein CBSX1, chloroplastic n=1 Tax=Apostasia shenzhenica TaxID=1088818 RepID=A0A2I0AZ80_9ASPA|nr:CBS domain-containing protein CBSX1, chloroplastic [Apostasia shenzhenica]
MATGVFPGGALLHLPAGALKSPASLPAIATDLSWFDAENPRPRFSVGRRVEGTRRVRVSLFSSSTGDLRLEIDENPEGILSGEWPENFSLLSYDDLRAYIETQISSDRMKPSASLGEVMSTPIRTVTADQTIEEIAQNFEVVSGLPVIDNDLRCIGIISRTDRAKASQGLKSKVGEVMSSPAITLSPKKTVLDAAALMLKKKIHRIPILNDEQQVIGIVTRSDIFTALEAAEV